VLRAATITFSRQENASSKNPKTRLRFHQGRKGSGGRMKTGKTKSSGWRPADKRQRRQEQRAREAVAQDADAQDADAQGECDRLRLWRACPRHRCRRVRRCMGEPRQCVAKRGPPPQQQGETFPPHSDEKNTGEASFNPTLPPSEAAAAIAAAIADDPCSNPGEEFEAIVRDGAVHYRRRGSDGG
jgi:hypothetical protein